jgi:hypothetical protein
LDTLFTSHQEWESRYQRREQVRRTWETPIILSLLGVLVAWYFLVYHYCPETFNPHHFNPKIHQVITPDGDVINDPADIADEDGYVYADKWRDPRTKKIYTPAHPDVVRGERAEKIARAIITFLCGVPLLYVYRLRVREWGDDYSEIQTLTRNGLLVCLVAGAISYFIPVVELALRLAGAGASRYSE